MKYIFIYLTTGMVYGIWLYLTDHRSFKASFRNDPIIATTATFLLWPLSFGFDLYFKYYDVTGEKRVRWEKERNEQADEKSSS